MTVTSTVPGPGELSCAYTRGTPPIDNTAISIAIERIIKTSLWRIRHQRIGTARTMPREKRRKHERISAVDGIGVPGGVSPYTQGAFLRSLGSARSCRLR